MKDQKEFMSRLLDGFKAFVLEAMDEGHHNQFPDHHEFLQHCMELFTDGEGHE